MDIQRILCSLGILLHTTHKLQIRSWQHFGSFLHALLMLQIILLLVDYGFFAPVTAEEITSKNIIFLVAWLLSVLIY